MMLFMLSVMTFSAGTVGNCVFVSREQGQGGRDHARITVFCGTVNLLVLVLFNGCSVVVASAE